jgi:hypothetical protein
LMKNQPITINYLLARKISFLKGKTRCCWAIAAHVKSQPPHLIIER